MNVNGIVGAEDEQLAEHAQRHHRPVVDWPPELEKHNGRVAQSGYEYGGYGEALPTSVPKSNQIKGSAGNLDEASQQKVLVHTAAEDVHVQVEAVVDEA